MRTFIGGILAAVCLAAPGSPAQACSTFQLTGQGLVIFGRNYDWHFSEALVMVNKAGVRKSSYPMKGEPGRPATWVSKYGSLTFNQYGREFPTGGMNSAGLVVESMSLRDTVFPPPDDRPYVASVGLWRQYLLDRFATVAEVLAHKDEVRLATVPDRLGAHVLISDTQGDCMALEFLEGGVVTYRGPTLPVRALTNSTYEQSLRHLQLGTGPVLDIWDSIARFKTIARMIQGYRPASPQPGVDFAFSVLEAVAADLTQWRIVYDQVNRRVYFHTKQNPALRTIDLGRLDFSCRSPVMMIKVDAPGRGEISGAMTPYDLVANRALIRKNLARTSFTKHLSDRVVDFLAKYGGQGQCAGP